MHNIKSYLLLILLIGQSCVWQDGSIIDISGKGSPEEPPPSVDINGENRTFSEGDEGGPIPQGSPFNFNMAPGGEPGLGLTWTCTYTILQLDPNDPNYNSTPQSCSTLPSLQTSDGITTMSTATFSNGSLDWSPTETQVGTYQFNITASNTFGVTDNETLYISVMEEFSTENLVSAYDAFFADVDANGIPIGPRVDSSSSDNTSIMPDYVGNNHGILLNNFSTSQPWEGSGSHIPLDPYALGFNGTDDRIDLGDGLNQQSYMFSLWIKPKDLSQDGAIIIGNGGGAGDGMVVEQGTPPGTIKYLIGESDPYYDTIIGDNPVAYFRLSSNGISHNSSISPTSENSPSYNQTPGALANSGDTNAASYFNGSADYIYYNNSSLSNWGTNDFTYEVWVKYGDDAPAYASVLITRNLGCDCSRPKADIRLDPNGKKLFADVNAGVNCDNRSFVTGSIDHSDNEWHHVVLVRRGVTVELWVDGVMEGEDSHTSPINVSSTTGLYVGYDPPCTNRWKGYLDEVAIYNRALTQSEIQSHFQAGQMCINSDLLQENKWAHLAGYYDEASNSFELFLNGRSQCTQNNIPASPPSSNLFVGADQNGNNAWEGSLGALQFWSEGSPTAIKQLFNDTANRYREIPQEASLFTTNLIYYLDAASAQGGLHPYATGCAAADNKWYEISDGKDPLTLTNFSGCTSFGWQGDGSTTNPFTLSFDGSDDYVQATIPVTNTPPYSICTWVKPMTFDGNDHTVVANGGDDAANGSIGFYLKLNGSDQWEFGGRKSGDFLSSAVTTTAAPNTWTHLCGTWDGSSNIGSMKLYVNGEIKSFATPSALGSAANAKNLRVGAKSISAADFWAGDMSIIQIYEQVLTPNQIKQNCHAQKGRFDGASCVAIDSVTPNVIVSSASGNTDEGGQQATIAVVLTTQPLDDVVIDIQSSNTAEGTVNPNSITFTPENWDTPQVITVTGQDDSESDGDEVYTINLLAAVSSDSSYNDLDPTDVQITNEELCSPVYVIDSAPNPADWTWEDYWHNPTVNYTLQGSGGYNNSSYMYGTCNGNTYSQCWRETIARTYTFPEVNTSSAYLEMYWSVTTQKQTYSGVWVQVYIYSPSGTGYGGKRFYRTQDLGSYVLNNWENDPGGWALMSAGSESGFQKFDLTQISSNKNIGKIYVRIWSYACVNVSSFKLDEIRIIRTCP